VGITDRTIDGKSVGIQLGIIDGEHETDRIEVGKLNKNVGCKDGSNHRAVSLGTLEGSSDIEGTAVGELVGG
jgi:hypothetical protein